MGHTQMGAAKRQAVESIERKAPQRARHVMPGLVPDVVRKFRTPRQWFTVEAVRQDEDINAGVASSALLHDLYNRVERLEKRYDAMSVRDSLHGLRRTA